jgi:hypothetical protein
LDVRQYVAMGDLLIEAEGFEEYGGWVLDSQFVMEMGSPYLLAHGSGRPVADARTVVDIAQAGSYSVWVRAKDWVPVHHPGRFELSLGNKRLATEFGGNGQGWSWQSAGDIELNAGPLQVTLHDLTGFDGRCDAIFLSRNGNKPVEGAGPDARAWRRRLRNLPNDPTPKGPFDLVIVGGGVTGSVGALVATRLGLRVAVVQNRPVLGGNASVEIGIGPRGEKGITVAEAIARTPDGDLQVGRLLEAEPGATVFLHHQVFGVSMDGDSINSVDACEAVSGREIRISGSQFIDCTGTAILGILANTPTMFGIEGAGEYSESHAPPERLNQHHGHTIFFRTRIGDEPVEFPDVPWAIEVAKDFADLGGQAESPGNDNGDGPVVEAFRPPEDDKFANLTRRLTHYWEYGQWCDPYTEGEHIRDHLLRAVYGTMSNIKILEPEKWANLEFDWVAHVPGQGEFRRYIGDHVLSENDIRNHVKFPDAVVKNSGAFCLHHPIHEDYDFRLKDWTWDERDDEPFDIPFRCLYSAHVSNLMMAGKHISVTHVAGSVCKFMGNGAQHAIATAAAASIAIKYGATPRQVHDNHLRELQNLIADTLGAE